MRTLERSGTNIAGMKWVWWRWWLWWKWWRGVGPSWVITGCRRIKGDADFSPVVLLIMDTVCNSAEPCTSKCEIFAAVPQSVLCYYSSFIVLLVDLISNLNCEVLLKLMYQPFRENLWPSGFTMACSRATLLNTVLHCTARQVWIADPPSWRETTQLGVNQTQWPGFEGHGICTFLLVLTKLLFENMFLSENHPSLEGHDLDLYNSELTIL